MREHVVNVAWNNLLVRSSGFDSAVVVVQTLVLFLGVGWQEKM
jgi:hypothetical protein